MECKDVFYDAEEVFYDVEESEDTINIAEEEDSDCEVDGVENEDSYVIEETDESDEIQNEDPCVIEESNEIDREFDDYIIEGCQEEDVLLDEMAEGDLLDEINEDNLLDGIENEPLYEINDESLYEINDEPLYEINDEDEIVDNGIDKEFDNYIIEGCQEEEDDLLEELCEPDEEDSWGINDEVNLHQSNKTSYTKLNSSTPHQSHNNDGAKSNSSSQSDVESSGWDLDEELPNLNDLADKVKGLFDMVGESVTSLTADRASLSFNDSNENLSFSLQPAYERFRSFIGDTNTNSLQPTYEKIKLFLNDTKTNSLKPAYDKMKSLFNEYNLGLNINSILTNQNDFNTFNEIFTILGGDGKVENIEKDCSKYEKNYKKSIRKVSLKDFNRLNKECLEAIRQNTSKDVVFDSDIAALKNLIRKISIVQNDCGEDELNHGGLKMDEGNPLYNNLSRPLEGVIDLSIEAVTLTAEGLNKYIGDKLKGNRKNIHREYIRLLGYFGMAMLRYLEESICTDRGIYGVIKEIREIESLIIGCSMYAIGIFQGVLIGELYINENVLTDDALNDFRNIIISICNSSIKSIIFKQRTMA
eukprot:GHVP01012911.1.p1 GENE.GHVP01012911.1~~GHVP01012911.1.p1  ORF type:complete len:587 (+),score=113.21 GHVP01012911.1:64-1824(+)